ncbi:MAG: hypothetical protein R3F43_23955 [bacterium]
MLADLAQRSGRGPWELPEATVALLRRRAWPGNVRQLRNALERATILRGRGPCCPRTSTAAWRWSRRRSRRPRRSSRRWTR